MKYVLLLLLGLPFIGFCQTTAKKKAGSNIELGFNVGFAPDNARKGLYDSKWSGGYLRGAISGLKNSGKMQYGITVEGGTTSDDYWYISPAALINRKFQMKHSYVYVGCMGGYALSDDMLGGGLFGQRLSHGYVVGLHAGLVKPVSKKWALTTEVGCRNMGLWTKYDNWPSGSDQKVVSKSDVLLVPVTIGVRCKL